ncbi:hypothetical protein [Enterococcus aquimarinus]|uniref:hypothetical protein n=1 Tax=Enterococcus aquimarinus TaxID=328396 RepID=UPI00090036F2|nr:hypothetical protein [Enterococcus aquimarinus]
MEKGIGITKEHAIQSVEGEDRYMLYYLQPSGFTGKSRSVRVTRRDGENSGDVVDKKGYKLKRRNSSKKQARIIINKYKEQLEIANKVNVTKFAKENDISRTMFYNYLKKCICQFKSEPLIN